MNEYKIVNRMIVYDVGDVTAVFIHTRGTLILKSLIRERGKRKGRDKGRG